MKTIVAAMAIAPVLLLSSPLAGAAQEPPDVFMRNCAPCHGKDGKAQTPAGRKIGAKDLSLSKISPAEIEKQILDGRKDDHGVQKMPSFRDKFSADELRTLIQTVKTFRQ